MVSFVGNVFRSEGIGLIPPRKVIHGGFHDIIGNGSDLFTHVIAHFASANFTNASPRTIDYDPQEVAGLLEFAGGVPATKLIDGKDFVQIETAGENTSTDNEDPINEWSTANADWDPTPEHLGGAMGKLIEDSSLGTNHRAEMVGVNADGVSQYCFSCYVKTNGRFRGQLYVTALGFPVGPTADFNIDTVEVTSTGVGADDAGIYLVKDGIYRVWVTVTSDAAAYSRFEWRLANASGNTTYNGDGVSGMYLWGSQVELGAFPSSHILTEAAPITRAKDETYWASANVPDSLRGAFSFEWIPYGDQDVAVNRYLYDFEDSGASLRHSLIYHASSNTIRVYLGAVVLVNSDALTFDPRQTLTITVYPSDGLLIISGATTGNGTSVGTPWATTEGNVWIGQTKIQTSQCNGLISEPYKPRYQRDPYVIADFDDAEFTNASPRDLYYPLCCSPVIESFAGGVIAERTISKNRFMQVETAVLNNMTENRDINAAAWTKTGVTISEDSATAPDGTATMDKLVEDSSDGLHSVYNLFTPDGAGTYVASAFIKAGERTFVLINFDTAGFPDSAYVIFDVDSGVVISEGAGIFASGIEYCNDGTYRCWCSSTSNAVAVTAVSYLIYNGASSYQGDGSSGLYIWNPQVEYSLWPSSPIHTEASPLTRAKDQMYWASANVPALLRGRIKIAWIPFGDQDVAVTRYLLHFIASGASHNIQLHYDQTQDKIRIWNGTLTSQLVASNVLTFSRFSKLIIILDPASGTLEVQGATTGDGENTGTPWSTSEGDVHFGMTNNNTLQCLGLITEPYL